MKWVFPFNQGNGEFELTDEKLQEYKDSYPDLDVESQLRDAIQWLRDNKRKQPRKNVPRFIRNWLSKHARTSKPKTRELDKAIQKIRDGSGGT